MRESYLPPADLRERFWTVSLFIARTLLEIWWWEILLPHRLRLGILNRNSAARRRAWARQFRAFALSMGGVWIKLGQFFSSRADLLPPDITSILADLQDEVQPVPWSGIEQQIRRELGGPPEQFYQSFDRVPRAAASLGQVHFALGPRGEPVAVKVQRPGIRAVVEIDLRALRWAMNWLGSFSFIRRRAKMGALYEEFAATLRLELDYIAEGRHAEQFAQNFEDDPNVDLPCPYWPLTTLRVLTLERVEGIKINDYAALEQVGINRVEVANKLFWVYLRQVFEDGLFHADPHPGNLFIRPRDEPLDSARGRPFDLIFIDFGMVGHISERSRSLMRRMVIAIARRDYYELVRLAKELGLLLPEADNRALVAAIETLFNRYYGMSMAELTAIDFDEIEQLTREFRDILYDFPFQIPQDFVFLGRTLSILSGIATGLHPAFSPLESLEPFGRRLVGAEMGGLLGEAAREVSELSMLFLELPRRLDRLLRRVEDGDLAAEAVEPALERLEGIEGAFNRLTDSILLVAFSAGWFFTNRTDPLISRTMIGGALWMLLRQLKGRR
jgi:predicted unusual protein kinase regulating ubiquinone biosynthesis (AarF/ABC1/UbiB family)